MNISCLTSRYSTSWSRSRLARISLLLAPLLRPDAPTRRSWSLTFRAAFSNKNGADARERLRDRNVHCTLPDTITKKILSTLRDSSTTCLSFFYLLLCSCEYIVLFEVSIYGRENTLGRGKITLKGSTLSALCSSDYIILRSFSLPLIDASWGFKYRHESLTTFIQILSRHSITVYAFFVPV